MKPEKQKGGHKARLFRDKGKNLGCSSGYRRGPGESFHLLPDLIERTKQTANVNRTESDRVACKTGVHSYQEELEGPFDLQKGRGEIFLIGIGIDHQGSHRGAQHGVITAETTKIAAENRTTLTADTAQELSVSSRIQDLKIIIVQQSFHGPIALCNVRNGHPRHGRAAHRVPPDDKTKTRYYQKNRAKDDQNHRRVLPSTNS
jgi:hypothetical protein